MKMKVLQNITTTPSLIQENLTDDVAVNVTYHEVQGQQKVECLDTSFTDATQTRQSESVYNAILKHDNAIYPKFTNDPARSNLEPTDQTCLSQNASNHNEINSQTGLEKESGTVPDKDNIITIESSNDEREMTVCLKSECQGLGYSQTIPNSPESLSQANHGISIKTVYIPVNKNGCRFTDQLWQMSCNSSVVNHAKI